MRNGFPSLLRLARSFSHSQYYSTTTLELSKVCVKTEWRTILEEGFLSLGVPQSEASNRTVPIEFVLRRLKSVGADSELLVNSFRQLSTNVERTLQWPGIVSAIFAKATTDVCCGRNAWQNEISRQGALVEILNKLHYSTIFNRLFEKTNALKSEMGNRNIAQLVTNHFLSEVIYAMGKLRNNQVVWNVASMIDGLICAQNTRLHHQHVIITLSNWEQEASSSEGIILANGCKSALQLAKNSTKVAEFGFQFGRIFSLAAMANKEIQEILNYRNSVSSTFSLSSLPVVLHLERYPETLAFIYSCERPMENLDLHDVFSALDSSGHIDEAKKQLNSYVQTALTIINEFKQSPESTHLLKLTETLNTFDE